MGHQTSAKAAGTQRLYFCHPCGARHSPPMGLKCKRKKPEELDGGEKECETSETPSDRRTK